MPINYAANAGIDQRLKGYYGLAAGDDAGLREALGVDFVGETPPYIVPKRHADIPERGVMVNEWGIHMRWIEHASGGCCDFSLQNATEEEVAAWPMPTADECDYGWVTAQCAAHQDKALYVGHAGIADVINTNGMLRGMEQTLVDLITDDPAGLLLARRRVDVRGDDGAGDRGGERAADICVDGRRLGDADCADCGDGFIPAEHQAVA